MNYKDFNDYELLDQIYSCNEDANEILIYKYRPLIVNVAKKMIKYCKGGVDLNDLIQEGMLGLNEAINTYREDKDAYFGTYAKLCIERRIFSLVRSTMTYKNKILNECMSIEDEEDITIDRFLIDNSTNPDEILTEFEQQKNLIEKINEQLTDLEKEVFEFKQNGFSYKEIADILDRDPKAIDNAIQRIKNKLKNIIKLDIK